MINQQLIHPTSIAVVGASNDTSKPGGKVLSNLIKSNFKGNLYAVNPKEDTVQGIASYRNVGDLPDTDLAILAIAAKYCPETVKVLSETTNTRAFVILSAGFSEESSEGAALEAQIVDMINKVNGSLIGPNCIGLMNTHHTSVFTEPIPRFDPQGIDFITGSGATAVFILENGILKGLPFNSVFSVGNSAQIGVEEVLEFLDDTYNAETSSKVKLLYVESINNPPKLLKHARSLIGKGCRIAAIKAGSSSAGSRAASSHTGALASSDTAVDALFRKAGIVRCQGREELTTVAAIFMHPPLTGKNIAVITHAGGPAVMLTDALANNGMEVPHIEAPDLLEKLFAGSSVANPIDFLATGTAAQLAEIIDHVNQRLDDINGMAVIFGSPGLTRVYDVYDLLDEKMKTSPKPIYPILPSVVNVKDEIDTFVAKGRIYFPDEVIFGTALAKVYNTPLPEGSVETVHVDRARIREIIAQAQPGYLPPAQVSALLDAAGIPRAGEAVVKTPDEAAFAAKKLGFPVVMKVVGPVHKSDVGGVVLNVENEEKVTEEFNRMIRIKDTTAILIQPMLTGTQIFAGAKYEDNFGHLVLFGLGGIFIEVLKDVQTALVPVSRNEAASMLRNLRSYKILEGVRGQESVNQEAFVDAIVRLSALCEAAPEIMEMDMNPLLGNSRGVTVVDARIRIEK